MKLSSPDYINTDAELAIEDFRRRIRNYEMQYETLEVEHDSDLSFMKIYNQGEKFLVNRVQGLPWKVEYYISLFFCDFFRVKTSDDTVAFMLLSRTCWTLHTLSGLDPFLMLICSIASSD